MKIQNQAFRGFDHEREMLELLCAGLSDAFDGVAEVDSKSMLPGEPSMPDGLIQLQGIGESVSIAVEVIRDAYPRDIRRAIWLLDEYEPEDKPRGLIKMVAAETLSPGAKSALKKRGFAFFERSGSLYLRTKRCFINIERIPKTAPKTSTLPLFTEAREGVVHALLKHTQEWMTGTELAEQAETSPYTCSIVLQELERREWCETMGAGRSKRRKLVKPAALLDAWAEQWEQREEKKTRWYTFVEDPKQLLTRLTYLMDTGSIDVEWAFTGAAAANTYAPLLTSIEGVEIIIPRGLTETVASVLKLKPASKGSNVTLIEREGSSFMFRDLHPEIPSYFASPYIMYLDLLNGRGRNRELATYIREKLEKTWLSK